jgi:predicted nucleic acid-binding protein
LILLDTNVVIDAQNEGSPFYAWSNQVIAEGISTDGVGINAITLAEIAQRLVDFCGVATLCTGRQLTKFARKANRECFRASNWLER